MIEVSTTKGAFRAPTLRSAAETLVPLAPSGVSIRYEHNEGHGEWANVDVPEGDTVSDWLGALQAAVAE